MKIKITAVVIGVTLLSVSVLKAQTTSPTQDTLIKKGNQKQMENKSQQAAPDSVAKQIVPKTQQDSAYKRKRATDPAIYPADSTQMK